MLENPRPKTYLIVSILAALLLGGTAHADLDYGGCVDDYPQQNDNLRRLLIEAGADLAEGTPQGYMAAFAQYEIILFDIAPDNLEAQLGKAWAWWQLGGRQEAIDYTRYVSYHKFKPRPIRYAFYLLLKGRLDGVRPDIKPLLEYAIDIQVEDVYIAYELLGELIYGWERDEEAALAVFAAGHEIEPLHPEFSFQAGHISLRNGDKSGTRHWWNIFLCLSPRGGGRSMWVYDTLLEMGG